MTLKQLAEGAPPLVLSAIGGDPALAGELQALLGKVGLLDPPVDRQFGPVSQWALDMLLRKLGLAGARVIDARAARAILKASASKLFPIKKGKGLAGRLVRALVAKEYWIQRHPDCVNIIYVEGMDLDGTPNDDAPNVFDDVRFILRLTPSGLPQIIGAWEATSEPGTFYTVIKPLDPNGAARIAFGQYKAWSVGIHNAGKKSAHEALKQTASIKIHRDHNKDFERVGDPAFEGLFGINQHHGFDLKKSDIGQASAGCLVGRTKSGHTEFMRLCKSDPRYVVNNSYRFMTAVLPASDVPAA